MGSPPAVRQRRKSHSKTLSALAVSTALAFASVPAATTAHAAGGTAQLRIDQDGYLPTDTKVAYLMTSGAVSGENYQVLNSAGTAVASGTVSAASRGSWNTAYPDVYPIDFSGVTAAGTYHVTVSGSVSASSDTFQIEDAASLYGPLVTDGLTFYQNQRDGSDVIPGALNRQPSHLNDATANLYQDPTFKSANSDVISGSLTKIGGPVDVSGGWFDAGDYLKFTFTASYADDILYAAARALGASAPASLTAEARYGTSWLNKMWNPATKTLYLQVGIGSGNETTYFGDHDLWRLPQADDSDTSSQDVFAAAHRPVFEAAAPGAKIDPDIVGRTAAAFAFAAQAAAASDPSQAAAELSDATSLYAMANTSPPGTLGSTLPTAYYPESIWHDDMELGATEIALAQQDLGDSSSVYLPYLNQAASWASDYIATDSGQDTLNLYDVSALAHADLVTAIGNAGNPSGLAVTTAGLIANLKAQVASAASKAASDIFREGGNYADFDVDSHTFGFISTEALYQKLSGDTEYAAFAGEQRDWLFGGNPWGASMMVGVGTTFPDCMQSQIPNLAGSLDGSNPIDTGAVVNGPNNTSNFKGGLGSLQDGMRSCENDGGTAFTGHSSEYVDDVRSWQTDEPALDMTGAAILAGATQEALAGVAPPPSNDFSLSVSPGSGSVPAGTPGSLTATVSTAVTAGSAETVDLTTSGAPAGVTATLSPTSVTSGGSSTMTLTTSASAVAGTYPITVVGTASSGSHSATYMLTISAPTGGGTSYEAESATLAGSAKAVACAPCSGGKDVTGIGGGSHGTVTFSNVAESAAGSYTLSLYYVSASKARSAVVTINGAAQTVTFPATAAGSVGTFTLTVHLNAGTNTVEISGSGSKHAPDLDRIVV